MTLSQKEHATINKSLRAQGISRNKRGQFISGYSRKLVVGILATIGFVIALGMLMQPEVISIAPVVHAKVDTRDNEQKVADQLAEFARQRAQVKEIQIDLMKQENNAKAIAKSAKDSRAENEILLDRIEESMNTLSITLIGE